MDASQAMGAMHHPGRGRVLDSIVEAIGDTRLKNRRRTGAHAGCGRREGRDRKRPEAVGKTILAIVPSFAERYLSTALFEGI